MYSCIGTRVEILIQFELDMEINQVGVNTVIKQNFIVKEKKTKFEQKKKKT